MPCQNYAVLSNILSIGGSVDPLKHNGQIELSRKLQILTAALDSTGMCVFITFATMDQPETFQAFIDLMNAFHGLNFTDKDIMALGKSILKNERDFNKAAGFTAEHDRLPSYFKSEKLAPHGVTFDVADEELDTVFTW
jgi:aldehyde:ferredoxin oxidoreductase